MNIEKLTFQISVIIQFLGILLVPFGLLIPIKKDKINLYKCLQLETIVNIIEFISYIIIFYFISKVPDIAFMRYYDWFITTPLLLLSVIIYFYYLQNKEIKTINDKLYLLGSNKYRNKYIKIIIYNLLMLLCGFLGELNIIPKKYSVIIGFIFFVLLFHELYTFARNNKESERFFIYFMLLWSLYGISYNFSPQWKNTGYNILDLFSKTFYGLFILYKYLY